MGLPDNYDDLPMNWVGDYSGKKALLTPNLTCIFDPHTNTSYTYKEVDDRASRLATYLVDQMGLKKGDRIALVSRNRQECIDLFFAVAKIGAILCPLSYRLQKLELKDLLARQQPQAIMVEDMFIPLLDASVLPESAPKLIEISDTSTTYAAILATKPRDVKIPIAMNDPFLYVHTGGTTAVPKICIVPHRQMVWNVFEYLLVAASFAPSREIVLFPFFHIGGWNVFFCLFMRNSVSITMRQFDAGMIIDMVQKKEINRLGVVEVMLQFITEHPKFAETDFSVIELITSAAAPCSEKSLQPFWDQNIPSTQAYGLTEAGPANFVFQAREHGMEHVKANAKKIGTPMFCCDYKIVDAADRDRIVPAGEVGVLCLRSFHTFDGYLNDPARTDKLVDADGWVYSGDLAVADSEGLVSIVGRADNMFITGGENVSPEEIEIALRGHPAVMASICTGIPDAKWGEVPVAMVALHPGQTVTDAELRNLCKERLAAYKVPKVVEIAPMIPVTPMGKLDRNALKRHFTNKASATE